MPPSSAGGLAPAAFFESLGIEYLGPTDGHDVASLESALTELAGRRRPAFTLIELMLVVIIIGALVAMVMPRLTGRTEQARATAAEADIRATYARVMDTLKKTYASLGVRTEACVGAAPTEAQVAGWRHVLAEGLGADAAAVAVSGRFDVGSGPISPDHIVYAKSYPFEGVLTADNLRAFKAVRGYSPRMVVTDHAVLGVGANEKTAKLALELALDGALIKQMARAFGGLQYLSDVARGFIENWDVESYRAKQA